MAAIVVMGSPRMPGIFAPIEMIVSILFFVLHKPCEY